MGGNTRALIGTVLLSCTVGGVCAAWSQNHKGQLQRVPPPTVYLSPSAFNQFPQKVALDLERRGCRIPQQAYTNQKTNVIRGEFASPGQTDWAVICSVRGVSRILVYWNGEERSPAEIAQFADRIYVQKDAGGRFQFLRGINPVGQEFIMKHFRAYGGPRPPPLDHQGIDDAVLEKGSITWYYYDGKWLELTGTD